MMKTQDWVFGRKVILHLLENHFHFLEKVFIKKNHSLLSLIKQKNVSYQIWSLSQFDKQFGQQNHQFVCALIKKYEYFPWKQFLSNIKKTNERKLVLILDHLQDPYNFGAILRVATATKVDAIIVPNFNQAPINSLTIKGAAGNLFDLKIIQVANLNVVIEQLKKNNFWIFASTINAHQLHYQADFNNLNIGLIVGNEHRGISNLLVKNADFQIKIPMFQTESLNVSNATAILLYQIRQNQNFWTK